MNQFLELFLPNTALTRFAWTRRLRKNAYISNKADVRGDVKLGRRSYVDDYVLIEATFGHIRVGERCPILRGAKLDTRKGFIEIGDDTWVEYDCVIYGQGGVKIGRNCAIAPKVILAPFNHEWPWVGLKETNQGITVADNVWLGVGAIVLDGVSIGEGSVIGAGSVVTKSIPSRCIAFGNPAKVASQR